MRLHLLTKMKEKLMEILFDKILEYEEELYRDNIKRHSFPDMDIYDGKGEDDE